MRKFVILIVAFTIGSASWAQADSSLTPEFAGLSAKERARLAKKEAEEAAQDTRFQTVMTEAEALFKLQRYDEALASFQQARSLRPLNVYPKVKIQDLQALIAKRESAAKEQAQSLQTSAPPPLPKDQVVPVVKHEPEGVPQEVKIDSPPDRTAERPVERSPRELPSKPGSPTAAPVSKIKLPDGLTERTFVEGRAIVMERRLVRSGVEAVYRKVSHPWGEVMHFRDGTAISEREWSAAFGGQ